MSHTDQSKPHSQSDDLWFQKSNYPANWLSEKSNEIINKMGLFKTNSVGELLPIK